MKRRGPPSAHLAVDYFMTREGDPCFLGRILYRCPPAGMDDCQLDSRCRRKKGGTHCPNVLTVCYFKTSSGGIPAPRASLVHLLSGVRGHVEASLRTPLALAAAPAASYPATKEN